MLLAHVVGEKALQPFAIAFFVIHYQYGHFFTLLCARPEPLFSLLIFRTRFEFSRFLPLHLRADQLSALANVEKTVRIFADRLGIDPFAVVDNRNK